MDRLGDNNYKNVIYYNYNYCNCNNYSTMKNVIVIRFFKTNVIVIVIITFPYYYIFYNYISISLFQSRFIFFQNFLWSCMKYFVKIEKKVKVDIIWKILRSFWPCQVLPQQLLVFHLYHHHLPPCNCNCNN